MAQVGLSEKFWPEAVATAVYLRSRMVTRSLKEKMTLYDWKPNVAHLRIFGCMAQSRI